MQLCLRAPMGDFWTAQRFWEPLTLPSGARVDLRLQMRREGSPDAPETFDGWIGPRYASVSVRNGEHPLGASVSADRPLTVVLEFEPAVGSHNQATCVRIQHTDPTGDDCTFAICADDMYLLTHRQGGAFSRELRFTVRALSPDDDGIVAAAAAAAEVAAAAAEAASPESPAAAAAAASPEFPAASPGSPAAAPAPTVFDTDMVDLTGDDSSPAPAPRASEQQCGICFEPFGAGARAPVAAVPCGHAVACMDCARGVFRVPAVQPSGLTQVPWGAKCPYARCAVTSVMRLYINAGTM